MPDIKSINNNVAKGPDEHLEQLRQKIGTDFSDRRLSGKKGRNEMGKDDFVKLMSAQLKHQDPLSPLKNEEMAAQLAQFSALEQMMNVNQNLEKMTAAQQPQENVLAASLIGKRVQTDTSRFQFAKGQQPEIKFDLPSAAESVNIAVLNAKGETVREIEIGAAAKGPQAIRWDGKNGKNQEQAVGEYTFRISATGEGGKPMMVGTSTSGLVSGVVFEGGKAMLLVDDKKIALDTVGRIEADGPQAAARAGGGVSALTGDSRANAGAKMNGVSSAEKSSGEEKTKSTQQVKNNLPSELSPEKIKSMLQELSASVAQEQAEAGGEATTEGTEFGTGVEPLWNPATNL